MEFTRYLRLQWDRVAAWVFAAAGAFALILGWVGVSATSFPAKQMPYIISGGIGGLLLVGIGATLWLSADLRDEWRKLDDLTDAVRGLREDRSSEAQDHASRTTAVGA